MALDIENYTRLSSNVFYFLTIIFFIAKYYLAKVKREDNEWVNTMNISKSNMLNVFYLFLLIISQLFINNNISKILCNGKVQNYSVFKYTLLPNIFIFGSLLFILNVFPHWAMPFSNTIGYFIVSFGSKLTVIFKKLLKKNDDLREFIKKNETLVINQMNPDNFDKVLDDILKFKNEEEKNNYYKNEGMQTAYQYLFKYVYQKHLISHFIWFLLAGTYTLNISQGFIFDIQEKCT